MVICLLVAYRMRISVGGTLFVDSPLIYVNYLVLIFVVVHVANLAINIIYCLGCFAPAGDNK